VYGFLDKGFDKGFALEIPAGFGSQKSGVRSFVEVFEATH
jgi:hypothetical protein